MSNRILSNKTSEHIQTSCRSEVWKSTSSQPLREPRSIWEKKVESRHFGFQLIPQCLNNIKTSHIIFSVDDILLFDPVYVQDFKHVVKDNNIFSLRLGVNINFCYTKGVKQNIPYNYKSYRGDIISWKISDAKHDFAYPFSLDMHVFSTEMIRNMSNALFFNSINSFEGALDVITKYISHLNYKIVSKRS